jgi:hypothetical protein
MSHQGKSAMPDVVWRRAPATSSVPVAHHQRLQDGEREHDANERVASSFPCRGNCTRFP